MTGITKRSEFLPFARPTIDDSDVEAVGNALRSGWLTHGPLCQQFERQFAEVTGAARAVSVSSCTAAMTISLAALGIGRGDEVITTPLTFCATANVVEHSGASVVFADIDPETLQVDPKEIDRALTSRTKAILPVHYAGHPCPIEDILEIGAQRGIAVIEDAAHGLGATLNDKPIGSFGTVTCFSFYATKAITTGEGGMVTTDDEELANRLESLRLHGISRDAWKRYRQEGSWYYEILEPGFKANLTDFQAALGINQLAREAQMRERRTEIAERYTESFLEVEDLLEPPRTAENVRHAWHLYPLRLQLESLFIDRNEFIGRLGEMNVGTGVHFPPVHLYGFYRMKYGFAAGDFPNAEHAFDRMVSLPIYPLMTDEDVDYVISAVLQIARSNAR